MNSHASKLKDRAAYKRGNCEWWKYTWPLHEKDYVKDRIYCPYLSRENRFAQDFAKEYLGLTDTTVLFLGGHKEDSHYLLGVLNSKLLSFRFRGIGKLKGGGIYEYFWNSISKLPIRTINFKDKADKARHDKMVKLVERMLELNKKLPTKKIPGEREKLERQIKATDREIDELVYELYGLTEEEIAVVEGKQ